MKKTIIVLAVLISLASFAHADVTWSGDVDPSDPSSWGLGTNGYIGRTGTGTMSITGGSDVIDGNGYIGYNSGSTGEVLVDGFGSTWSSGQLCKVGYAGNGTLNITNGGVVSGGVGVIAVEPSSTGVVTINGPGSMWTARDLFYVAESGEGTLNITNGGAVSTRDGFIGNWDNGTGVVTVDGSGSTWTSSGTLRVGGKSSGTLNVTDGGLVSVRGILTIDHNGDDDSFINMATGGQLALFADASDSILEFLGLVEGTDAIRYWDGSGWTNIVSGTYGVDYTLEYITDGDLEDYTVLTVNAIPEPATMLLFGLGGMMLRKRC